jgi:hypothetical protein
MSRRNWLVVALIVIAIGGFIIVEHWRSRDIPVSPTEVAAIYAPIINDLCLGTSVTSAACVVRTTDDGLTRLDTNYGSVPLSKTVQDELAKTVTRPIIWVDNVRDAIDENGDARGSGVIVLGNIYADKKGAVSVGASIAQKRYYGKRQVYVMTKGGGGWAISGTRPAYNQD